MFTSTNPIDTTVIATRFSYLSAHNVDILQELYLLIEDFADTYVNSTDLGIFRENIIKLELVVDTSDAYSYRLFETLDIVFDNSGMWIDEGNNYLGDPVQCLEQAVSWDGYAAVDPDICGTVDEQYKEYCAGYFSVLYFMGCVF